MKRLDPHSPSNLVTEDYEFAYAYDGHPEEGDRAACVPIVNALLSEGWRFGQVHGGDTCDHCGARLRYVAVLKHAPTHTLIKVGEDCLNNRFDLATAEFHRLRTSGRLNAARTALSERRAAFISDERNAEAVEYARKAADAAIERFERKHGYPPNSEFDEIGFGGFYVSITEKFERDGFLSEPQIDAVLRGKIKDAEFAAKREAERAAASPVVEGRVVLAGEIVKIGWQDNAYGGRAVMTVKDDRGFRVWGSVPGDEIVSKGDRIEFTATVTKSDDETFGFFKRPAKYTLTKGA